MDFEPNLMYIPCTTKGIKLLADSNMYYQRMITYILDYVAEQSYAQNRDGIYFIESCMQHRTLLSRFINRYHLAKKFKDIRMKIACMNISLFICHMTRGS
eukprot:113926_1